MRMGTAVNVGAARRSMSGRDMLRPARKAPKMTSEKWVCWGSIRAHAPRTIVEMVMLDPVVVGSGKGMSFWKEVRACGLWDGEGRMGNC